VHATSRISEQVRSSGSVEQSDEIRWLAVQLMHTLGQPPAQSSDSIEQSFSQSRISPV
jgi:hypothetical protein